MTKFGTTDAVRKAAVEKNIKGLSLVRGITKHTTNYYAEIKAELFRKHAPRGDRGKITKKNPKWLMDSVSGVNLEIDENDLWLAASALETKLTLVSEDKMEWIKEACDALDLKLDLVKWKT